MEDDASTVGSVMDLSMLAEVRAGVKASCKGAGGEPGAMQGRRQGEEACILAHPPMPTHAHKPTYPLHPNTLQGPPRSLLDTVTLALWEQCAGEGLFRYDVTACPTKVLPGQYGFVAQLNTGRATQKRATEFRIDQVGGWPFLWRAALAGVWAGRSGCEEELAESVGRVGPRGGAGGPMARSCGLRPGASSHLLSPTHT